MAERNPRRAQAKKKMLAPDQLTANYPPPTELDSFPVRGGKRLPDKDEATASSEAE